MLRVQSANVLQGSSTHERKKEKAGLGSWSRQTIIRIPQHLCQIIGELHHFMGNSWGNSGKWLTLFFGAPKSLQMVTAAMKLKDAYSLEGKL